MKWIALLGALFTSVTLLEVYLLLQLGALMGPTATFGLVVFTGFLGAWLVRHEGVAVLGSVREDLLSGTPPASRVVEGVLVLCGALLLVTPGVLTDLTGVLLVAPPTRRWLAPRLLEAGMARIRASGAVVELGTPQVSHTPFHDPHFDD